MKSSLQTALIEKSRWKGVFPLDIRCINTEYIGVSALHNLHMRYRNYAEKTAQNRKKVSLLRGK
jgi:hypothetical protein